MGTTNKHITDAGRAKAALMTELGSGATENVEFFHETVTVAATAAATATSILSDARVGASRKVYPMGYLYRVNGTGAWVTAATFKLQDTASVDFSTVSVASTTFASQARVGPWTTGQVLEDAFSLGSGGTAAKGLQVIASANQAATDSCSSVVVTAWGVIKG